jgi:ribosome-associated protein YbcJ (S4-like RNA binding protein)
MLTKEELIPTEVYEKIKAINLDTEERKRIDREFLYFLAYLEQEYGKKDENGFKWVKVPANRLQLKKWDYQKDLQLLEEEGIIKRSPKFKKSTRGKKGYPKAYRLVVKKKLIPVDDIFKIQDIVTNGCDIDYTPVTFTDKYFDDLKPKVNRQIKILKEDLTIDPKIFKLKDSLKNRVKKREIKKKYIKKIFEPIYKLKYKKKLRATFGRTNRIFHPFGRVKSALRYYLEIEGEKLVEMDLVNSQMFFLFLLIKMYYPELLKFEDIRAYGDLVTKGKIYEHLVDCYNKKFPDVGMTRNLIKKTVLQAFFSKEFEKSGEINRYRRNTREVIKEAFPNLYDFIVETKKENYKLLSRKLQKMEAEVFIDRLFELASNFKYLTVHDALYCKVSDMKAMEQILRDIFIKEYGIVPNIKVNVLKKTTVKKIIDGAKEKRRMKKILRKQKI